MADKEKRKLYQRKNGKLVEQLIASAADIVQFNPGTFAGKTDVTNVDQALNALEERDSVLLNGLDNKVSKSTIDQPNGVAGLDGNSKIKISALPIMNSNNTAIDSSYLPSYVDDTIEGYFYNNKFYKESAHITEITGESGKIYVDLSTNKTYRWSGSSFVEISASLALGETSSTAYPGDKGKANAENLAKIIDEGRWYLIEGTITGEAGSEVVQLDKTYSDIQQALNEIKIPVLSIANNINNYHYYFVYSNKDDEQGFTFQCNNNYVRLMIYVNEYNQTEFVSGYNLYNVSDNENNSGDKPIVSKISNSSGTVSVTRRAMTSTDLPDSGVTAGTYSVVTVDAKGRATAGAQLLKWGTTVQTEENVENMTLPPDLADGGIYMALIE